MWLHFASSPLHELVPNQAMQVCQDSRVHELTCQQTGLHLELRVSMTSSFSFDQKAVYEPVTPASGSRGRADDVRESPDRDKNRTCLVSHGALVMLTGPLS